MYTVKVKEIKEIPVKYLKISVQPRYWEDSKVNGIEDTEGNLIPCRKGELFECLIDLDTKQILDWEQGKTANIYYKVCDAGSYYLLDENKNVVSSLEDSYVINMVGTWGDYLDIDVNQDGVIEDLEVDLGDFEEDINEWKKLSDHRN